MIYQAKDVQPRGERERKMAAPVGGRRREKRNCGCCRTTAGHESGTEHSPHIQLRLNNQQTDRDGIVHSGSQRWVDAAVLSFQPPTQQRQ